MGHIVLSHIDETETDSGLSFTSQHYQFVKISWGKIKDKSKLEVQYPDM